MPTIQFNRHPATVSLDDAVSMAVYFARESWQLWILPVAAIVLVNVLAALVFGNTALNSSPFQLRPGTNPYAPLTLTPAEIAGPLAVGLVTLVAGWFVTAISVAGLRGRPITSGWVIGAGLRSIGAALLIILVATLVIAVFAALVAISPIFLLSLLLLVPAAFYAAIRLLFWGIAIFDGAGVLNGLRATWHLTRNSLLRLLGWGLGVTAIGFGVGLISFPVSLITLLAGVPAVGTLVSSVLSGLLTVFGANMLAILYESQRWRYAAPVMPVAPVMPAEPRSPFDPPPPPPPPPGWPQG